MHEFEDATLLAEARSILAQYPHRTRLGRARSGSGMHDAATTSDLRGRLCQYYAVVDTGGADGRMVIAAVEAIRKALPPIRGTLADHAMEPTPNLPVSAAFAEELRSPNRWAALRHLLSRLFDEVELRVILGDGPDGDAVLASLPNGTTSMAVFHGAVQVLRRRGLVGPSFFRRLRGHRERRVAEIDMVAARW